MGYEKLKMVDFSVVIRKYDVWLRCWSCRSGIGRGCGSIGACHWSRRERNATSLAQRSALFGGYTKHLSCSLDILSVILVTFPSAPLFPFLYALYFFFPPFLILFYSFQEKSLWGSRRNEERSATMYARILKFLVLPGHSYFDVWSILVWIIEY